MRDHGGDLDRARVLYGGDDWLDLSTGINACPFPLPAMPDRIWNTLPTHEDIAQLEDVARRSYSAPDGVAGVALAGAQGAIQLVPRLRTPGSARVVAPTYNEHAGALIAQGWQVSEVPDIDGLAGADLGIVVNPNNPDGRLWTPEGLLDLALRIGLLVVDESFADPAPEYSVLRYMDRLPDGVSLLVLRSFGKFYGLAGVRLGFAFGAPDLIDRLRSLSGPWAVSGPAIAAGRVALSDGDWHRESTARLSRDAVRMDALAERSGWRAVGGTVLFRTYDVGDAAAVQDQLAKARIWVRSFPYSTGWLRFGLPGDEAGWQRLAGALNL